MSIRIQDGRLSISCARCFVFIGIESLYTKGALITRSSATRLKQSYRLKYVSNTVDSIECVCSLFPVALPHPDVPIRRCSIHYAAAEGSSHLIRKDIYMSYPNGDVRASADMASHFIDS